MATAEAGHITPSDSTSFEGKPDEQIPHDAVQVHGSEPTQQEPEPEPEYKRGFQLIMIMCTINLTTLIASLDLGIVATAIPAITDDFHALDDIGWYSGACFILVGATSAMWGKLFTYLPAQWVYMSGLLIYLIGSIVAAAAPTSNALIAGRAIQGIGCSGGLSGSVIIINFVADPRQRPILIGTWMSVFVIATILGPLLGGVFTSEVSWQWCFWINLPVGGVALVMQLFYLRMPKHVKPLPATWKEIMLHLDFLGFALLLSSLVCYTLALQWGGLSKPWSKCIQTCFVFHNQRCNGSVVATLVMFGVLTISFFVCEWFQGSYAMIPLHMFKPRKIWTQTVFAWLLNGPQFMVLFYLPIYFQSIKGTTAITSGVYQLPYVAFFALGSMISGGVIQSTHHLQPIELIGSLIATLGAGLIYNLDIDSSKAWYIGAQIPFGLGIGLGSMVPVTALQGFSKPEHIGAITGALFVCQTISGGYFNTAANSVFSNRMLKDILHKAPEMNPGIVLSIGATELRDVFSGEDLTTVVKAYMTGIKSVWYFVLAAAASNVLLTVTIPIKKLPSHENKKTEDAEAGLENKEVTSSVS